MIYELHWTSPFSLIGQYRTEEDLYEKVRVFIRRCREEKVPLPSMTYIWRLGRNCGVMADGEKLIQRAEVTSGSEDVDHDPEAGGEDGNLEALSVGESAKQVHLGDAA